MKRLFFLLAMIGGGGPVRAQQDFCYHKVRHITCHWADGKTSAYDTDPNASYYNIPPYMTFRTKDGGLHAIIGACEMECHP